jgi:hypothetical protein
LTAPERRHNLNFMRRLIFGYVLCAGATWTNTRVLPAQGVPGRDLFELPLSTVAEAPVLATLAGDGFWNPATVLLRGTTRLRFTGSSLEGPADQGLSAQLISAAYRIGELTTVGLSISRASVSDLIRTEDNPQSIGSEIPYNSLLVTATAARRTHQYLTVGVSARYRYGEIDADHGGAVGFDGGVMADRLPWRDVRIAASTFLWRPADVENERTRFSAGTDLRVYGPDTLHEARAGYAMAYTEPSSREHYAFVGGRYRAVEGRAGMMQLRAYGEADWRFRMGIGMHHARYFVGIAREESGVGLRATYAFTLTTTID